MRCAGCGLPRGLDQFRGASERCVMSAPGVQMHLVEERLRCPSCGDRRVAVRFGWRNR